MSGGLRALLKLKGFSALEDWNLNKEKIWRALCLQETNLQTIVVTTRRVMERLAVHYASQRMALNLLKGSMYHDSHLSLSVLGSAFDEYNSANSVGINIVLYHRRRKHNRHIVPFVFVLAGAILFLFVVISFLAPTPIVNSQHHHHLPISSNVNGVDEVSLNSDDQHQEDSLFHVPKSGGGDLGRDIWSSRLSNFYYGCSNATRRFSEPDASGQHNRYVMIATSGGLNQQRTGITDAVVAAHILNATLIVPKLDQKSFWKDTSNFSEIFNVDWFISSLSKDLKIIKQLPANRRMVTPYSMRVPRKCNKKCYLTRVLPVLEKKHVIQLSKFDYRLANKLEMDLQKLRCRVNYHALKFTDSIREMGNKLVVRMKTKSKHFIALHLRFEADMLAFSGCYYGGGDKERNELGAIRKRWKTLHTRNPEKERRHGKCPLTPGDVGLMLRALGYGSDVHIYVASGDVYGGEETLAPLKSLFPNYHSKETLARDDELHPFASYSSRLAALDFIVCDESDVFVTNNNGNMARMLAGRRRYFGHKPTIRPNAKKLYKLFLNQTSMTWEQFASGVRTSQIGFMGEPNEVRPGRGEFHENPAACICENNVSKSTTDSDSQSLVGVIQDNLREDVSEINVEKANEEHREWHESDYTEGENGLAHEADTDSSLSLEQPEVEELFSD